MNQKYIVLFACIAVELLALGLMWPFEVTPSAPSALYILAAWYNVIPLAITAAAWYFAFDHGTPSFGPLWLWHSLFYVAVFAIQVGITYFAAMRILAWRTRASVRRQIPG